MLLFCGRRRVAVARYRMICLVLIILININIRVLNFITSPPKMAVDSRFKN